MRLLSLLILFLLASGAPFVGKIVTRANDQHEATSNPLNEPSVRVSWPAGPRAADPRRAFEAIRSAALQTGVAVLRVQVKRSSPTLRIEYFVLKDGDDVKVFGESSVVAGRPLDVDLTQSQSQSVVSTQEYGTCAKCVGVLRFFDNDVSLKIAPLANAFADLPVAGQYLVAARKREARDRFVAEVNDYLISIGSKRLTSSTTPDVAPIPSGQLLEILTISIAAVCAAVIGAVLVRATRPSVFALRLLGATPNTVFTQLFALPYALLALCSAAVLILSARLATNATADYTWNTLFIILTLFGVSLLGTIAASLRLVTSREAPASLVR